MAVGGRVARTGTGRTGTGTGTGTTGTGRFTGTTSTCNPGGRRAHWQEALGLLREMPSKGVERNTITYNAAISACEKGGQWKEALGLLSVTASKDVERDTITYNTAVFVCVKGGHWQWVPFGKKQGPANRR